MILSFYMASLPLRFKTKHRERTVVVEVDANKLERLASAFGFFNPDFLASLDRAERDIRAGRVRKVSSLRDLRA